MARSASKLLLTTVILCFSSLSYAQNTPSVSITNWQGNKKAAVCVTLDDGCDAQLTMAKPIMDSLLIKGTFYIITDLDYNCDGGPNASPPLAIYNNTGSPTYWSTLQTAINTGHEIGAHTVHHPELATVTWADYGIDSVAKEIKMSKATLEQELHAPGQSGVPYNVLTFAYPYGDGENDTTIIDTIQKYFVAARGAGTNSLSITWDTYADAKNQTAQGFINYYYQVESYACTDTLSTQWFTQQLDNTIQNSGWYNAMYHNIGGNSIQGNEYSVSVDSFRLQMKAIAGKSNTMWIAPFKDVARYSKENISSAATVKTSTTAKTVIGLTTTLTDTNFSVPLTLLVSNFICKCTIDSVMQAGIKLAYTQPDSTQMQFNAVPNAGDITIYTGTDTVTVIDTGKGTGPVTSVAILASDYFELYQNVPNPAFPTTAISYNLKQAGTVTLELFDMSGTTAKTIVNEEQSTGRYTYSLNTELLQAGIYFYRLTSGNTFDVKKMVVIR